jgi:hypothetical protein
MCRCLALRQRSAFRPSETFSSANVYDRLVSRRDNGTFFAAGGIGRSAVGAPLRERLLRRIGSWSWNDEVGSIPVVRLRPVNDRHGCIGDQIRTDGEPRGSPRRSVGPQRPRTLARSVISSGNSGPRCHVSWQNVPRYLAKEKDTRVKSTRPVSGYLASDTFCRLPNIMALLQRNCHHLGAVSARYSVTGPSVIFRSSA